MKESENRTKVTLEDLLHFKRAERPPAEFWPEFDRQLRSKQLAAIVEERPRWRSWMRTKAFSRVYLPIGATAALALAISSVRTSFRPGSPQINETAIAAGASAASPASVDVAVAHSNTDAASEDSSQGAAVAQVAMVNRTPSAKPDQALDALPDVEAEKTLTLSGRFVEARLAAAMILPESALTTEPVATLVAAELADVAAEPSTQNSPPRDNRRTRLLAYSVRLDPHAPDSSDATRSRERITRRLSDEALYDSISRLGLTGDSVSIKF